MAARGTNSQAKRNELEVDFLSYGFTVSQCHVHIYKRSPTLDVYVSLVACRESLGAATLFSPHIQDTSPYPLGSRVSTIGYV